MINHLIKVGATLVFAASCSSLSAQSQWRTCELPPPTPTPNTSPISLPKGAILVEADSGSILPKGISELEGNVIIRQDGKLILADKATYNNRNSNVTAFGNVLLTTESMKL